MVNGGKGGSGEKKINGVIPDSNPLSIDLRQTEYSLGQIDAFIGIIKSVGASY